MRTRKRADRKEKKILIRVSAAEKQLTEELSQAAGKNTSQFFRDLLKEHAMGNRLEGILKRMEAVHEAP